MRLLKNAAVVAVAVSAVATTNVWAQYGPGPRPYPAPPAGPGYAPPPYYGAGPAYGAPQAPANDPYAAYAANPYSSTGTDGQAGQGQAQAQGAGAAAPQDQQPAGQYAAPPGGPGYPYAGAPGQPPGPAARNPWAPYYPWAGGQPAQGQGGPGQAPQAAPGPGGQAPSGATVAANVPGVPPVLNQPGQAAPGTAAVQPGASASAQVGPASFASATGAPGSNLPPAPTAGGVATDIIRIVDAGENATGFDPTPVRIPVNQPITWLNSSSGLVQIVAEDGSSFDSGVLAPGDSYSYTPTLIGSFYYRDKMRPWVRGVVVATPQPPAQPQPRQQPGQVQQQPGQPQPAQAPPPQQSGSQY